MRNAAFGAVCFLLSASAAYAQAARSSSALDKASDRLLRGMRGSFHAKVGGLTGIGSVNDIEQTQLGPAIPTFRVELSALRAYDGTSPAASLFSPTVVATRLLRVNGTVRSCHVLAQVDGEWTTLRIGQASRAAAIDRVTQVLTGRHGADPSSLFLIEIPDLSLEFLAFHSGGTVVMAWLGFGPNRGGLVAEQPVDAESVLGSLSSAAQSVGGSPRR